MHITAPITDYIRASVLTTQGDMVYRAAADPDRLPASLLNYILRSTGIGANPNWRQLSLNMTGVHIGSDTRNTAGAQVITGVGFQSSAVIFLAKDDIGGNMNFCWGFDTGAEAFCMYIRDTITNSGFETTNSIRITRGAGQELWGNITTMGADGFTITWALAGACVADFIYLCLP